MLGTGLIGLFYTRTLHAQRNRDSALGIALPDDEAIKFGDDFTWGKVSHGL